MAGRAQPGNKNGTKIKDPYYRQEAYKQYCEHIGKGLCKESWHFLNPDDILKSLCSKTMDRYIKENPTEFPPILLEMAQTKSFGIFEQDGIKLMKGQYKHGSPETWKTFMRNKFKWDKEKFEEIEKCAADQILAEIRITAPDKAKHYQKDD